MENETSASSIIKHKGFLNLWLNQILVQLSYNSLNFALIIWVYRLTDSNLAVSVLMFTVYLPAVLFGIFSGILVDVIDRRKIIMFINLFMSLCFFSLIFLKDSYFAILAIAFLVNCSSQFYLPAESSAIPLIVKKDQLLTANSLFSTTLFASFLIGFGLSGPLLGNLGIDFLFATGGILLFLGFILSFSFPKIASPLDEQGKKLLHSIKTRNFSQIKQIGLSEVQNTINLIRGRLVVMVSLIILASIQVVIGILAVLIPSFFEKTLEIHATDASYIAIIPLGLGMILGGFLIGKMGYKFPKRRIVSNAILTAGLLFFSVGIAPLVSPVIKYFPKPTPLPFTYQPSLSTILTLGSFLLGIMMVSIVVPTQTVLQQSTPDQDRGKVFAVLGVLMAGLSLIPVLLVGFLADLFGSMPIFIALGGSIALIGLMALKPDFYFEKSHLPFKVRQFLGLGHWKKSG